MYRERLGKQHVYRHEAQSVEHHKRGEYEYEHVSVPVVARVDQERIVRYGPQVPPVQGRCGKHSSTEHQRMPRKNHGAPIKRALHSRRGLYMMGSTISN